MTTSRIIAMSACYLDFDDYNPQVGRSELRDLLGLTHHLYAKARALNGLRTADKPLLEIANDESIDRVGDDDDINSNYDVPAADIAMVESNPINEIIVRNSDPVQVKMT